MLLFLMYCKDELIPKNDIFKNQLGKIFTLKNTYCQILKSLNNAWEITPLWYEGLFQTSQSLFKEHISLVILFCIKKNQIKSPGGWNNKFNFFFENNCFSVCQRTKLSYVSLFKYLNIFYPNWWLFLPWIQSTPWRKWYLLPRPSPSPSSPPPPSRHP